MACLALLQKLFPEIITSVDGGLSLKFPEIGRALLLCVTASGRSGWVARGSSFADSIELSIIHTIWEERITGCSNTSSRLLGAGCIRTNSKFIYPINAAIFYSLTETDLRYG